MEGIRYYRGALRKQIESNLFRMGFDTDDVMLELPLRAIWTAIEDADRWYSDRIVEVLFEEEKK